MQKLNIKIHGKVQGVFFRESTKAVADQLGIRGWMKNESDGSVYIEAEAEKFLMDSFLEWCNEGPERADVALVEVAEDEVKGFQNFVIKK